jgi:hypothetical protein
MLAATIAAVLLGCLATAATAATVTVTSSSDDLTPNDGSVSLREAITAIDAGSDLGDPDIIAQTQGPFGVDDEIRFDSSGPGVLTIKPSSALPAITTPLTIDGRTQPGAGGTPKIGVAIDGSGAGSANGIAASAPITLNGLDIESFTIAGVRLAPGSDGSTITGNLIGTNPSGTAAAGNGIGVEVDSNGAAIDANVISGNAAAGVTIGPTSGNTVEGNFIGTDLTGTTAIPNGGAGVVLNGGGQTVAGTPAAPQRIWFNGGAGIADTATGDTFRINSIAGNAAGGISVPPGAPTGSVSLGTDHRTVTVSFSGATPGQLLTAEAFDNPAAPVCPGQGQTFLASETVPVPSSGTGAISFTAPAALPVGDGLTATLTDGIKGTSGFACLAGGVPPFPPTPPPLLSGVSLSPTSFTARHGTKLLLTLAAVATVSVKITQTIHGRRVERHCVAGARKGKRCTKTTVKAKLTRNGAAGANSLPLRVRNLSPGRYSATVSANAGSLSSEPVTLTFTIKK